MSENKIDVRELNWSPTSLKNGEWGKGPSRDDPVYAILAQAIGETLCTGTIGNYYGGLDMFLVVKDGRYGYIEMRYGTCNMCDPITYCDCWEDLQEYFDEVVSDMKWMSHDEAVIHFSNPITKSIPQYNRFCEQCLNKLELNHDR